MVTETRKLVYPSSLEKDFAGNPDTAYMLIYINDTLRASRLKGDSTVSEDFFNKVNVDSVTSVIPSANNLVNFGTNAVGSLLNSSFGTVVGGPFLIGNILKDLIGDLVNDFGDFIGFAAGEKKANDLLGIIEKDLDPQIRSIDTQQGANLSTVRNILVKRLNKVIALPMPNDLSYSQSVSYKVDFKTSALDRSLDVLGAIDKGNNSLLSIAKGAAGAILARNTASSNSIGDKVFGSNEQLLAKGRLAINPRKEQLFEDLDFRAPFVFNYIMTPRSQKEFQAIFDIILTLRYYMTPELDVAKAFYLLPAEFEIKFMLGNKENSSIPKIGVCVLKRVSVNYAPKSQWVNTENGFPPEVTVSLEFQEIQVIDRDKIAAGEGKNIDPRTTGF